MSLEAGLSVCPTQYRPCDIFRKDDILLHYLPLLALDRVGIPIFDSGKIANLMKICHLMAVRSLGIFDEGWHLFFRDIAHNI